VTIPDERLSALAQKFEEPLPESWIPKQAGDELIGTFVRLDKGTTAYGDCWIVVLESARNPGRFASVWLINQALVNEFSRVRPQAGDLIGVRYGGKKAVKNPTPGRSSEYHDWKVVTERELASAAPNWDAVGGTPPTGDFHDAHEVLASAETAPVPAAANEDDIPF